MRERRTAADWAERCADLKPAGRGKWSGPCPLCGGVDRFHVESRADGGAIIGCRGCIDGQPLHVRRARFGELVRVLWPSSGHGGLGRFTRRPSTARAAREAAEPEMETEQAPVARLWTSTIPDPGPVHRYLAGRGAWPPYEPLPDTVRWLPADELVAARAFSELPVRSAMEGAMVCAYRLARAGPASAPVAVNVETLTDDGRRTRPRFRKHRGPKLGAAFIVDPGGTDAAVPIHVTEGEIDAMAIACWRGVEAWAAGGSRGLMPRLSQPLILDGRGAVIEADGGAAGELAAVLLLEALANAGVAARILWAPPGTDPADMLTVSWRTIPRRACGDSRIRCRHPSRRRRTGRRGRGMGRVVPNVVYITAGDSDHTRGRE